VSRQLPDALTWLYTPGWIVITELPEQFTEPRDVPGAGTGRLASGSAAGATPVIGAGENLALPVALTPPVTKMLEAVTVALPVADSALVEQFEFTWTRPAMLMLALPVSVSAPQSDSFITKINEVGSVTVTPFVLPAVKVPSSSVAVAEMM
jgi:hypothetical protein